MSTKQRKLTAKEQAGLIWEYWFRVYMDNGNMSIADITKIIKDYYNNVVAYKGTFLKDNVGDGYDIVNDLEIAFGEKDVAYKSAKLDTAIEMNSSLIYRWQFMIQNEAHITGIFEMYGVVSDECNNIGQAPWGGLVDVYGMGLGGKVVWKGTGNDFGYDDENKANIGQGEVVTIELDCHLSELVFKLKDDIIYGPMKLPQRKAWYPAIALGFSKYKYIVKMIPLQLE